MDVTWRRQTRAEIEAMMRTNDLAEQMKSFGLWQPWLDSTRGRKR